MGVLHKSNVIFICILLFFLCKSTIISCVCEFSSAIVCGLTASGAGPTLCGLLSFSFCEIRA